jgi:hypothetical protein
LWVCKSHLKNQAPSFPHGLSGNPFLTRGLE